MGTETFWQSDKLVKTTKLEKTVSSLSEMAFLETLPGVSGKGKKSIGIYWIRSENVGGKRLGEKSGFKNRFDNYLTP